MSTIGIAYRDLEVAYAQEDAPLGTGGAIKFAGGLASTEHLLVMNGDSYFNVDLAEYLDWHAQQGNDASLLLVRVPDASRYGAVRLDDDDLQYLERWTLPSGSRLWGSR